MPDTSLPDAGTFTNASTTNGGAKQAQDDIIAYLRERFGNTDNVIDFGNRDFQNAGALLLADALQALTGGKHFTPQDVNSNGGVLALDFTNGNVIRTVLSENVTSITIAGTNDGGVYELWVHQAAASSFTLGGWPPAVDAWTTADGLAPSMSAVFNARHYVQLRHDGAVFTGSILRTAA